MVARALTIATSDSGGGAGIQADLKAFAAAGVHGSSVLVALTAQNTRAVTAIHELPPEFVIAQLDAVFDDIGADAAKTGMLFSAALVETVAGYLERRRVPLVVDPVMVASSGARLLEEDAVDALVTRIFPRATVVTPNLLEARAITACDKLSQAVKARASRRFGVTTVASGKIRDTSASTASSSSSRAPELATITGSTTSGTRWPSSQSATVSMIARE